MIKYKMDNRGKAAALVGLSAIGSILAYYGYSQYGNESGDGNASVNNEIDEKKEVPVDEQNSESETISETVSKYLTKIVGAENIKLQVTEEDASTAGNKEAKSDLKVDGKAVLKEALEGTSNNSIEVDGTKTWSKYWTNEYNKQQDTNNAESDREEGASAADFN
jgi:hypothetical protein